MSNLPFQSATAVTWRKTSGHSPFVRFQTPRELRILYTNARVALSILPGGFGGCALQLSGMPSADLKQSKAMPFYAECGFVGL